MVSETPMTFWYILHEIPILNVDSVDKSIDGIPISIWVRQWEGWHPIYEMENNPVIFQTTKQLASLASNQLFKGWKLAFSHFSQGTCRVFPLVSSPVLPFRRCFAAAEAPWTPRRDPRWKSARGSQFWAPNKDLGNMVLISGWWYNIIKYSGIFIYLNLDYIWII